MDKAQKRPDGVPERVDGDRPYDQVTAVERICNP